MPLTPGQRLGAYEIVSPLGAGGMGEVYRARDTKLLRDVAIKVLPSSVAGDRDRLARFEREAQLLAALNHPHIAGIFGLEQTGDASFLAMELVDGETLAVRIARGALAVSEAMAIATQLAEALQAAHDKGIIHRDLKPANIALTGDGQVKVLDFGLAKAMEAAPSAASTGPVAATLSPTMSLAMTEAGMILGTAAYMSPEQAKGRPADKRSDVWAFGCVLFEMLAGKRAFEGEDASDTLAGILRGEPDWKALPQSLPPNVRRLLEGCLEKDRSKRLADIAVASFLLRGGSRAGTAEPSSARSWKAATAAAALTALVAGGFAVYPLLTPPPPAETLRFTVKSPDGQIVAFGGAGTSVPGASAAGVVVSPDGRHVAFLAGPPPPRLAQLWIRSLDSLAARPLPGTEGASGPFWSPDSRFVAFFANGRLRKIDITGGPAVTLAEAPDYRGGAWGRGGTIVFAPGNIGPLLKVADTGGVPAPATVLDDGDGGHARPAFLPDGRRFFYRAYNRGIFLGSLDDPGRSEVFTNPDASNVAYAAGYLLFVRETTLMAQPFDLDRGTLGGEPVPIVDDVLLAGTPPIGTFSVSETGVLAYVSGEGALVGRQLTWFDRTGKLTGAVGEPGEHSDVQLSPDGSRTALSLTNRQRQRDIWIIDNARGIRTRFTFGDGDIAAPVWSPDGSRIVYVSRKDGRSQFFVKPTSGGGSEQRVFTSPDDTRALFPKSWSPDGQVLLYLRAGGSTNNDIMALPMSGSQTPRPYLAMPYGEQEPVFAPDGRWVAYVSNESGRVEVYVAPFPEPTSKTRISADGGRLPRWSRDGRTLYFVDVAGKVMGAGIDLSGALPKVAGVREVLDATGLGGVGQTWDVTPDGRFLLNLAEVRDLPAEIGVILNWTNLLRK